MRFPDPSDTTTTDGEPVPDGNHVCDITQAKERTVGGRDVMIVTFTPVDGGYMPFTKFLDPGENRDRVTADQLRKAIGLPDGHDLFEDQLVGQRVVVTTKLAREQSGEVKVSKRGEPVVYVNAIAPATPAPAKPRTQAAKVAAARGEETGGGDDIPF